MKDRAGFRKFARKTKERSSSEFVNFQTAFSGFPRNKCFSHKSIYTMANAWTTFATNHYRKMKKINPSYKFKHALKDAGKLYNKTVSNPMGKMASTMRRVVRKGGKTRKNGKSSKSRK